MVSQVIEEGGEGGWVWGGEGELLNVTTSLMPLEAEMPSLFGAQTYTSLLVRGLLQWQIFSFLLFLSAMPHPPPEKKRKKGEREGGKRRGDLLWWSFVLFFRMDVINICKQWVVKNRPNILRRYSTPHCRNPPPNPAPPSPLPPSITN